jgi:hypothetical protein
MSVKIVKSDGIYKASRIAGPKHNFLGLGLVRTSPGEVQVVPRGLQDEGTSQIDEAKLLAAVSEAVVRGSRALGLPLFVDRVEYVPTDTPDYSAYTELADAIVHSAVADLA